MEGEQIRPALAAIDRGELTDFLQKAVQIPSHVEYPGQEKEIAQFIHQKLVAEGIDARLEEVVDGRPNVVAVLKGQGTGKSVTYNGHMDSIPPFDMPDAFSGKIVGDRIYGRGVCDQKAGIVSMAYALVALKRSGLPLPGDVVLAAVVGEEYESCGTQHFVKHGPKTDFGVVSEPTGLGIGIAHKGIEWMSVRIPGRSIHSSVSEKGVNAIKRANQLMNLITQALEARLQSRLHPLVGKSLVNLGRIVGGEQPNVVPGECELQLERRYLPGESLDSVYAELQELVDRCQLPDYPELNLEMSTMPYSKRCARVPLDTPADSPIVSALKAAGDRVGQSLEVVGLPYWCDAAVMARAGIPTVVFGPGDISQAHSANENASLNSVYIATQVFTALPFVL